MAISGPPHAGGDYFNRMVHLTNAPDAARVPSNKNRELRDLTKRHQRKSCAVGSDIGAQTDALSRNPAGSIHDPSTEGECDYIRTLVCVKLKEMFDKFGSIHFLYLTFSLA